MNRKSIIIPTLILALSVAGAGMAQAKEQYAYSVKFVCGYNPDTIGQSLRGEREGEPPVKFGNYATEINIVWPELYLREQKVYISKHIVLLVEGGRPVGREPNVAQPLKYIDSIELPSFAGTMDDCNRIAELVYGRVPTPMPLTIGYLMLASTHEIDVTAVYTSQVCSMWSRSPGKLDCLDDRGAVAGVSTAIDVEQITGRKMIIQ
jgi:hypothetical protein